MPRPLSRRDFLAGGVIICGAASATTIYMLAGGRPSPKANLRLVTGEDATGARELLLNAGNHANPSAMVEVHGVSGSTSDQRRAMMDAISNNDADIVNLDIIHIPYFPDRNLITTIELEDTTEDPEPTRLRWAAARVRTTILVLLSTIFLGLLVVTFQGWELSSAAASVAVVASLVLEGFALRLTYLSYQEQKKLERILMTASPLPRDKAERPE